LDVTSAEDIAALDERLPASLDGVVNNAGIAVGGPVEGLALDEIRRQFEVNLIGQVAVTQAVLPRLRVSRGRVVFVSSLSGRVAAPMTGAYSASKFALEGLADTLRLELRPCAGLAHRAGPDRHRHVARRRRRTRGGDLNAHP
jgi:NAD(P)-dependent dehydrogenase (short-subunit alcohol dehydrogenase family)